MSIKRHVLWEAPRAWRAPCRRQGCTIDAPEVAPLAALMLSSYPSCLGSVTFFPSDMLIEYSIFIILDEKSGTQIRYLLAVSNHFPGPSPPPTPGAAARAVMQRSLGAGAAPVARGGGQWPSRSRDPSSTLPTPHTARHCVTPLSR